MRRRCSLLCAYVLLVSQTAFCAVTLPRLVSDGMVLQRDIPVKIWGWADGGETVTIRFEGKMYRTAAEADGKWVLTLPSREAGGPYDMEISGSNRIELRDILVGDVWVCSGQSNMQLWMGRVKYRYADVIARAGNPRIRQFLVSGRYDFDEPQEDLASGRWVSADPESVLGFTAVGYFFAKTLYEQYGVPIGLINAALGGSPAEAWLSEDALRAFPEHMETVKRFRDRDYRDRIAEKDKAASDAWYARVGQLDRGMVEGQPRWYEPDCDASEWATMDVPGYWADEDLGPVNGVVWFRKEINVPASMTGKPARLWMGRIVDGDSTYVNGALVGSVSYQYPPRIYDVPADLLTEGKNVIVVRIISNINRGGFVPDKPYRLEAGGQSIDLKGAWQYRLGAPMEPLPGKTFIEWQPLGLYNGMIAPLTDYGIKGVIWYQGESNVGRPLEYQKLLSALIVDWREEWGQGDVPFLYVQLANFLEAKEEPGESDWAELREAQLKTLAVPNTGMAVAIDLGEWNDIHPLNKEDVGKRLALAARKLAYGDSAVVHSGPIYESMRIEGDKIVLAFAHVGSGLVSRGGGALKHFAIAGADKRFVWAQARIEGNEVVVWNENVTDPMAVRYAWADNPEGANLYNREGLPASPFRTDN